MRCLKLLKYALLRKKHEYIFDKIIPELERKYEKEFRVNSGTPCNGLECKLLELQDFHEEKQTVCCVTHFYIHICDEICNSSDQQCMLFARCICQRWVSSHNMPLVTTDHTCAPTKCKFQFLMADLYICTKSGLPHLCTSSQCQFKKPIHDHQQEGEKCSVSRKQYNTSNYKAVDHKVLLSVEENLEKYDLSSRKRKLTYKDNNGKDVEVFLDVPWGLDVGDDVDGDNEDFGKKHLLKYNKEGRVDPIKFPKEKKIKQSEDIYDHVDMGPYGNDGGARLDFREYDEDYANLGDYETMRGQIGDEDDIVEEFQEDEDQEFKRTIADLDFRLEKVQQREKEKLGYHSTPQLEGKKQK